MSIELRWPTWGDVGRVLFLWLVVAHEDHVWALVSILLEWCHPTVVQWCS